MSVKGSDVNTSVPRSRGRSPSLPRNRRSGMSPTPPSILEINKLLTSTEARNAPIYNKPTVCSLIYAQSLKKPCSSDKIKPPRRSLDKNIPKILSAKTSFNENGVSPKSKDPGKPPRLPLRPNNSLNVMEKNVDSQNQTGLLTTCLVSKSMDVENPPSLCDAILSSKDILIDKMDTCENDICYQDNVTFVENVNKEHMITDHDHDSDINQDQENQELEIEHVPPSGDIGLEVVEHEKNKPKEPEIEEEPEKEDPTAKVLAQWKKDTAACNNVKEEAVNEKLRDRVKQLVGVFESVISHESNALQR